MSVSANFNTFCNNLKVSEDKKAIISLRFNAICEKLNKNYWELNSTYGGIYIGSYGRRTANTWINEVEMVFEMPVETKNKFEAYINNVQSVFLSDIKKSIAEIYPSAEIDKTKNTIKIKFSDKITLHVLPVFRNKDESYSYADLTGNGAWKKMHPIAEIKAINHENKLVNNNLIHLCRMAHAWKRHNNVPIKEILLDTLASQFLLNSDHRNCVYADYDTMCLDFFKFIKDQEADQTIWKAIGSNRRIYNPDNFRYKAIIAFHKIESAIEFEKNNRSWRARQKWREVFGTKFPESIMLEEQLRKLAEKTAALQKSQMKCASIVKRKDIKAKISQIFLAGFIISGLLMIGYTNHFDIGLIVFGISAMLFLTNIYIQKTNLSGIINRHKQSVVQLYQIQENINGLLIELESRNVEVSVLSERKEKLHNKLQTLYKGTTMFISKTYQDAALALSPMTEESSELIVNSQPKIRVPIWQGNKFYLENQVHIS